MSSNDLLARAFGFLATIPFRATSSRVAEPRQVAHGDWVEYLTRTFNRKGMRVLELGSRNVTGINLRSRFSEARYVGFDFYAGENVDVVGDAHRLSRYFGADERFDLIFSSAVFEHLSMPWVVAAEIQKLLKVGGYVFVETHFSFGAHERPWHFFQFSDQALRVLFNKSLGFDVVDSGMSNPMAGFFTHQAEPYLRYAPVAELYCHSEILCRKRCEVDGFDWNKVEPEGVVGGTRYPPPMKED
jgi:hypothetical protein